MRNFVIREILYRVGGNLTGSDFDQQLFVNIEYLLKSKLA